MLLHFADVYAATQSPDYNQAGQPRQRKVGGGSKAQLASLADKLLFILIYHKTYPLQPRMACSLGSVNRKPAPGSIGSCRCWSPVSSALVTPRNATRSPSPQTRRRWPYSSMAPNGRGNAPKTRRNSGTTTVVKKVHTDKTVLLADERTRQVVYLSPTHPGKTHDKRIADEAHLQYPAGTQLTHDTGFQGYAPANVHILQPKKQMRGQWLSASDVIANRLKAQARAGRACHGGYQTLPHCQRRLAQYPARFL